MAMRAQKPGVSLLSLVPSYTLFFQFLEQPPDKMQKPKTENAGFQGCFLGWHFWFPQPKGREK